MPPHSSSPPESPLPYYLDPYRKAVDSMGARFVSLLWRSRAMQEARFAAMNDLVPLRGRGVADIGCGLCDLLLWARRGGRRTGDEQAEMNDFAEEVPQGAHEVGPPAKYVGVEGLPAFTEAARRVLDARATTRGPAARTEDAAVIEADFVADHGLFDRLVAEHGIDTILFSGSLNTIEEPTALEVLERAWQAVSRTHRGALVFNFLSDAGPMRWTDVPLPAQRFATLGVLSWAIDRTPLVRFRHDHLEGQDAAIAMLGGGGWRTAYVGPG